MIADKQRAHRRLHHVLCENPREHSDTCTVQKVNMVRETEQRTAGKQNGQQDCADMTVTRRRENKESSHMLGHFFAQTSVKYQPYAKLRTTSPRDSDSFRSDGGLCVQGRESRGGPGLRTKGQGLGPLWFAAWCEGTLQIPVIMTHSLSVLPGKVAARSANTSRYCRAPHPACCFVWVHRNGLDETWKKTIGVEKEQSTTPHCGLEQHRPTFANREKSYTT